MDDDFDDCFALKCHRCSTEFCGWCLRVCGADTHNHTAGCRPRHLSPSGLFPHHDNNRRYSAKH